MSTYFESSTVHIYTVPDKKIVVYVMSGRISTQNLREARAGAEQAVQSFDGQCAIIFDSSQVDSFGGMVFTEFWHTIKLFSMGIHAFATVTPESGQVTGIAESATRATLELFNVTYISAESVESAIEQLELYLFPN